MNKFSQVSSLSHLRQVVQNSMAAHEQLKAFVTEGLLVLALGSASQGSLSRQSKGIVRSQLAAIAGGHVKEALVHPVLLSHARNAIG